jgi:hypothetical protein
MLSTTQATWAILREIDSPVTADLFTLGDPGLVFEQLASDRAPFRLLSRGEQYLVRMARGVWTGNPDVPGSGVAALMQIDTVRRARVLQILTQLYVPEEER